MNYECDACGGSHATRAEVMTCSPPSERSGLNDYTFTPWTLDSKLVLAPEAMWKKPLEWNRKAECNGSGICALGCQHVRPRVLVTVDPFADFEGPMVSKDGWRLANVAGKWMEAGMWHDDINVTMADVLARLFALSDECQNFDIVFETQWPQNVRAKWPPIPFAKDDLCDSDGQTYPLSDFRSSVTLAVPVDGQQQAGERIPWLLTCRDLVKSLAVVYSGVEPLNILPYIGGRSYKCNCGYHETEIELAFSGGDRYLCVKCGGRCEIGLTIDRVEICVEICGEIGPDARPCNIANVRYVLKQCEQAGVECRVERLGSNVITTDICDAALVTEDFSSDPPVYRMRLQDPTGATPDQWPSDLQERAGER